MKNVAILVAGNSILVQYKKQNNLAFLISPSPLIMANYKTQ